MEPATGQNLVKALKPVLKHITRQHYVKWLVKGLMIAAGAALPVFVTARIFPIYASSYWAAGLSFLLLLLVMLRAFWLRPDLGETALTVDRAGLKERVSTAWQLRDSQKALAQRQRQDALEHLEGFTHKKALPWSRPNKQLGILAAILVVVFVLAFWPNPMNAIAQANHEAKEKLIETQAKVKEVEELVRNNKQISDHLKKQLSNELTKLKQELRKAKSLETGAEALAKTQKELTTKLGQDEEQQKLDKLALRLQQSPTTKEVGAALQKRDASDFRQQMENLEKKMKEMDLSEREKLAKFLEEMAKSLEKVGDPDLSGAMQKISQAVSSSGQAGAEAMANLSEQLSKQLASGEAANRLAAILNKDLNSAKGNMLPTANLLASGTAPTGSANSKGSANSGTVQSVAANDPGKGGSQSGEGNGNSGSGNGNGSGSGGSGSGSGSGGGKGGNGAGNGSSNQTGSLNSKTGVGAPGFSGTGENRNNREGHWDKIYVPSGRLGNGGQESRVSSSAGDNSADSTMVDTNNGLALGGSLLPYSEVFTLYEAEARESMEKEYVPENLKALVREYFFDLGE
ncbi:MAG: hypothetical protein ACYDEJ_10520 [Desulfitobacteriaceae bacterium]